MHIHLCIYTHASIVEANADPDHHLARPLSEESEVYKPKPILSLDRDVVLPLFAKRTSVPPSVLSAIAVAVARKKRKANWDVELHWFVGLFFVVFFVVG